MVMALTVPLNDAPERIRGWSMMCGSLGRSDVPPRDKMVQHPRIPQALSIDEAVLKGGNQCKNIPKNPKTCLSWGKLH